MVTYKDMKEKGKEWFVEQVLKVEPHPNNKNEIFTQDEIDALNEAIKTGEVKSNE